MSRNDWHEAKMGTCVCGRWAKVLDDMCAECHDAERQDQREAAYLKRIRELEAALQHIRDYYYSAEMCREIAAAALDGRDDYKEPRQ